MDGNRSLLKFLLSSVQFKLGKYANFLIGRQIEFICSMKKSNVFYVVINFKR